jgi:heme/copper-type cytochrome/quinol oxidase subunit 2
MIDITAPVVLPLWAAVVIAFVCVVVIGGVIFTIFMSIAVAHEQRKEHAERVRAAKNKHGFEL